MPAPRVASPQELNSAILHELNNVLTVLRTDTHFARQPTTRGLGGIDLQRVLPKSMHAVALRDEIERAVLAGISRQ